MADITEQAGAIYAETRARISELVVGADPSTNVPATPAWSVWDVIAHMAGNVACILEGRLDGVASDEWTAAQIAERQGRSLQDLLDEWNGKAPEVEAMVGAAPPVMAAMLIADVASHEQDLRHALQKPGARDSRALLAAYEGFTDGLGQRLDTAGSSGLRLQTESGEKVVGAAAPRATVKASRFDLARAMGGRRSAAQVRAFDWDGDPEPYVAVFTPFRLRDDDLVE